MNKSRNLLVSLVGILSMLFVNLAPALAASATTSSTSSTNTNGQALEIAPPLITMTVNPGQKVTTQISIRDVSSGPLLVTGTVNDFVAAGEDGTPKILLNNDANDPYSLKDWVSVIPSLTLQPHQINNLPVTFSVPASASPGGHYGVIRFSGTPPDLHSTGVALQASLGTLVLLTVRGNIKDSLSLVEFSVNKNGKTGKIFESAPLTIVERVKNDGNTHEEPNGLITIKNIFGKAIGEQNVNQPPKNVLPGSIRRFSEPIDKTVYGNAHMFGYYKATMVLKYANGKTLTGSTSFWVIPYKLMAIIVVLLVAAFFLLRYQIRRHDQKIMQRARSHSVYDRKK